MRLCINVIPETIALLGINICVIAVTQLEGLIPMVLFTIKASMLMYVLFSIFPSPNIHGRKVLFLTLLTGIGDRQWQEKVKCGGDSP